MKKIILTGLALMSFVSAGLAGEGAELTLVYKDGTEVTGELLAVKHFTLILRESVSYSGVNADIRDLAMVHIIRKSKALLGGGIGLLLGGVIGYAVGSSAVDRTQARVDRVVHDNPNFGGLIVGSILGWLGAGEGAGIFILSALGGGLLGTAAGAAAGADLNIQIFGQEDSGIQKTLAYLRSKAAFPKESY